MNQRHVEWLGPDLGRGPFTPHRVETAAVQIATALAQTRAPLTRADNDLLAHGDFIRQLADRLAPDYAAFLNVAVGPEVANVIQAVFRTALPAHSLLDCWLADDEGGGLTSFEPDGVSFTHGQVLETVVPRKRYLVITDAAGVATVDVTYGGTRAWRWAVCRLGRITYSDVLAFGP